MLIGICGGIGSGKSTACAILEEKGYPVYDCDSNSKRIMDTSNDILSALNEKFGESVCPDKKIINRTELAKIIFNNEADRKWLNHLVKTSVKLDIDLWYELNSINGKTLCFVESAILASSGFIPYFDEIWYISADEKIRIERVKKRSGLSEEDILKRIEAQKCEEEIMNKSAKQIKYIVNNSSKEELETIIETFIK